MQKKNIDRILSFDSDFDKVEGIVRIHKYGSS
jgi:predicted nucleic acid-binding protein